MMLIPGQKIILRDWRDSDLEAYAYWLAPGRRWKELDAPYYPGPDLDEIPDVIAQKRALIARGHLPTPRNSLIIAARDTEALIGSVSRYWQSQETRWLSVGIVIFDPAHWRRGVGYEALGLWSDHIFHTMPELVRLDLRTWSGNTGMMRLAEKLGYREEARFRKARIVADEYYDAMGYGVLREEWEQCYPQGFAAHFLCQNAS
jgi:putative hydrolase of HD superfamily